MTKIHINLATRRYPGKGLGIILPVAIILLSAVLSPYLVLKARGYNDAIERVEKRLAGLIERQDKKTVSPEDTEMSAAALAVVNEIIGERNFSWVRALDDLEKAIPPGISLSSIQPSFKEEEVKLSGYARDFAVLSKFIDNLEGLKVYKRVFLLNHAVKEMENNKKAVLFNINIEGAK